MAKPTFSSRNSPIRIYSIIHVTDVRYTKFFIFQRLVLHIFVLAASVILLSSVTIPMSFPVLVPVTNGSVGLGEFGSSDPTYTLPAFKFTGFLDDSTHVVGLAPTCQENGCLSYFLPGGMDSVNSSCQALYAGVPDTENICAALAAAGSGGDTGVLAGIINNGGIPTSALPNATAPTLLDVNLTDILNGGDTFFSKTKGQQKRQLNELFPAATTATTATPSSVPGPGSANLSSVVPGVNIGGPLSQVAGNALNWTAYRGNATQQFGTSELAYVTYDSKGYILDFSPVSGDWPPFNNLCGTWIASYLFNITLTVCVASETNGLNQSTILGGIKTCDEYGFFGPMCSQESPAMQFSTRMTIRKANGTTAYALNNGTILSFGDLSDPIDHPINITTFFNSLIAPFEQSKIVEWLQIGNPGSSASDVTPLLVMSLVSDFTYDNSGPQDGTYQLRNMMANAISTASLFQDIVANASPQALTKIVYTLRLSPATLYTFIILGCLILIWCLPVMAWSSRHLTANTSGFPEVDFASKGVLAQTMEGLSNAESRGVVQKLGGELDVHMGEAIREMSEARMIVLDTAPAETLRRGVVYT